MQLALAFRGTFPRQPLFDRRLYGSLNTLPGRVGERAGKSVRLRILDVERHRFFPIPHSAKM